MNKKLLIGLLVLILAVGGACWYVWGKEDLPALSREWLSIRYGDQPLQLTRLRPEGILVFGVEEKLNTFPYIHKNLLTSVETFIDEAIEETSEEDSLRQVLLTQLKFEKNRIEIALRYPESFVWGEEYAPAKWLPASLYYYHPIRSREDAVKYLNRLAKIDTYIQQYIKYLSSLSEQGYQPHPWIVAHQVQLIDSLLCQDLRNNVFYAGFQRKVNQVNYTYVNENDILTYLERIIQLLEKEIYPSFLELSRFLESWNEKGDSSSYYQLTEEAFQQAQYFYTSRIIDGDPEWMAFTDSLNRKTDKLITRKKEAEDTSLSEAPVQLLESLVRDIRLAEGKADLYTSGLFEEEFSFYTRVSLLPDYLAYSRGKVQFKYGSLDTVRRSLLYIHPSYVRDDASSATQVAYRILSRGEQTAYLYPYYQDSSLTQARRAFSYPAFPQGWGWYMYETVHSHLDMFAGDQEEKQVFTEATYREYVKWKLEWALHQERKPPEEVLNEWEEISGLDPNWLTLQIMASLEEPGKISAGLVGWFSWNQLRESARKKYGRNFVLQEFHQLMLAEGMLPFESLAAKVK